MIKDDKLKPEQAETTNTEQTKGTNGDSTHDQRASNGSSEPATTAEQAAAGAGIPLSPLSHSIAVLIAANKQTHDVLLRTAADFENYKKRSRREITDSIQRAEERVVLDFLPVIDNLERALGHADVQSQGLLDGVKMVHKQFLSMLEKNNIRPFDSMNQPFDPELHEAIQQMPAEQPANTVCQELQRGYLRGDRLVRPAMVIVSTGAAATASVESETEGVVQAGANVDETSTETGER